MPVPPVSNSDPPVGAPPAEELLDAPSPAGRPRIPDTVRAVAPYVVTVAVMLVVTIPAWVNSQGFYDDNLYGSMVDEYGIVWVLEYIHRMIGFYRILAAPLQGAVWALNDQYAAVRFIGVVAFTVAALSAYSIWRVVRLGRASGYLLLGLALTFPFAMEVITWPTNAALYVVPSAICLGAAYVGIRPGARVGTVVTALFVVVASPLFQEQLLGLALLLIAALVEQRRWLWKVAVPALLVSLLLLVWSASSATSLARFQGPDKPSVFNVFKNYDLLWSQLRRLTPAGDLYWDNGSFGGRWALVGLLGGAVLVAVWGRYLLREQPAERLRSPRFVLGVATAAALSFGVSVAPYLSSGQPWFSPRVSFIPFYCLWVAVAAVAELVVTFKENAGRLLCGAFGTIVFLWGATALSAEAQGVDAQLAGIDARMDRLAEASDEHGLTEADLLVIRVGGYSDVDRPLLGEHLVEMVPSDVRPGLGLSPFALSPAIDFGWYSEGLCVASDGVVLVDLAWVSARPEIYQSLSTTSEIAVALWDGSDWVVSTDGRLPVSGRDLLPACPVGDQSWVGLGSEDFQS